MELKRLNAVTVAQLDAFDEVIDVRSPAEFAHDHVPAAVNCPVLDDAERAHVGTLYKQISPFDAKKSARRWCRRTSRSISRSVSAAADKTGAPSSIAGAAGNAPRPWPTCCARSAGTRRRSKAATARTVAKSWRSSMRHRNVSASGWCAA